MKMNDCGSYAISRGAPLEYEEGIGGLTLGKYLREISQRFSLTEAAVIRHGDRTERWSYHTLWARSQEVAKALLACGVGKEARVGLLMTNRLEFLSGLFGSALAGCVATPISTFFTASELDEVLQASGCAVLLLERNVLKKNFCDILLKLEPGLKNSAPGNLHSHCYPFLRHLAMVDTDETVGAIEGWHDFLGRGTAITQEHVDAANASVSSSDPGTLFFSSGSTGRAKGILSTHRAVCLQLWRWKKWWGIHTPPRTWSANGFFFSGNFSMALGGTLSSGGTLLLQRYFDAREALILMEEERATMPLAWPHQWAQLEAASNYAEADLTSLYYVDSESLLARHPSVKTHWRAPNAAYGSTEGFTLVSVFPAGTSSAEVGGSHGVPTHGTTIKIVDPITGELMSVGKSGEISFKGPTLMLGYLGIPIDQTLDDDGYFRTGDGGHLDQQGRLFWEGRLNDIIKTGGANVSPLEIDDVIRNCPGVKLNQTIGVPDELLGEVVVTCVVKHDGSNLDQEAVQVFAKQRLASYKVPRHVLFFSEGEFEITGSSKIKTTHLRQLAKSLFEKSGELVGNRR